MIDLKKELEESERARANQGLHVRTVKATRTEHECAFCRHEIEIGSFARTVTKEVINQYTLKVIFTKPAYYHSPCFLQTYPNYYGHFPEPEQEQ